MGKRKDERLEEEIDVGSPGMFHRKKHKKHKHKKHKKTRYDDDEGSPTYETPLVIVPPPVKGPEKINTSNKKTKKARRDSGTSSEEERWLDAIESGKLEEVDDELMKMKPKDPKLMTARQRAMLKTETFPVEETLLALPSGYKEKVITEEMAQKAALKSQRRKQQADEKREKDKKKTMERLLKKQESKAGKGEKRGKSKKQTPRISYHITGKVSTISIPVGFEFPLQPVLQKVKPENQICGVENCSQPKKYCCSRTGIPLCSLECYKKNLSGTEFG
ncbi:INO80 complex subunit B [Frankliniella fusca]|uniref:INO80 complex subunit B n=1 Tax=Frankliniella fusca TaxID=407009 RepID=A0AAE1H0X6_9NEOP|nr:INO80 complex subunit B [Frankliniella fusca]